MANEEHSFLLTRLVQGHESLVRTFWLTLLLLMGYGIYQLVIPGFTRIFDPFYLGFWVFLLTWTLTSMHHACADDGTVARLFARTYVLLLMLGATYLMYLEFGTAWAVAYPFLAVAFIFVVKG